MTDSDRFEQLMQEAYVLDNGEAKIQLLEEAVKIADTLNDEENAFWARMQLTEAATFAGRSEIMLTSFSWCLAKYESEVEQFEDFEWDLMWHFKWAAGGISAFPHVSNDEFLRILDQMKRHYQALGFNMRPVHYTHFRHCCDCGDYDQATELLKVWPDIERDDLADCEACEADAFVTYYAEADQAEKAIEAARHILSGDQECAEVPHITYSTLLRSMAQLGRYDEADEFQAKDYRMIRDNAEFLRQVGEHISYLCHRGNTSKALSLLEEHLEWALATHDLSAKYYFIVAVTRLLGSIEEPSRKLRLPPEFPGFVESGEYDISQLRAWFENQRQEIAERFDARNQNDHYSRRIVELMSY